jgi:hypothetical protein
MSNTKTHANGNALRFIVLAVLLVGAFFGAYQFAQARSGGATANAASTAPGIVATGSSAEPGAAGCSCCGSTAPTEGGVTGDPVEGAAEVAGDVQTISVDLSQGYYQPNVLKLKAGVPAQITFGQSSGCTGQVMSQELGFFEDLSAGPVTVDVPALDAGEHSFSCGMEMVFGKIVVE